MNKVNFKVKTFCMILQIGLFFTTNILYGQGPPLDWAELSWAPTRPLSAMTNPGSPQTQGESRDEWWQAMTPIYNGGILDGYATVGYVSWWEDPTAMPKTIWHSTDTLYLGAEFRQSIAIFELDGTLRWCKPYLMGRLFGVVQDANEDIVATGWAWSQSGSQNGLGNSPVFNVGFNPVQGVSPINFNPIASVGVDRRRQLNVVKVDIQGNVIWNNYYSHEEFQEDALPIDGRGTSLIETNFGGNHGYRVLGTMAEAPGNIDREQHPVLIDINTNGELPIDVLTNVTYLNDPNYFPMDYFQIRGLAIQKNSSSTSEDHAITGFYRDDLTNLTSAYLMHFDGSGSTTPVNFLDLNIGPNDLFDELDMDYPVNFAARHNVGFDVSIVDDSGSLKFIWSIVDQYEQGARAPGVVGIFNGAKIGNLDILAFHFDQSGNAILDWHTNLGEVQAYDIVARTHISQIDGNVFIGSTKMSDNGSPDQNSSSFTNAYPDYYAGDDFEANCLTADHEFFNQIATNQRYWPNYVYNGSNGIDWQTASSDQTLTNWRDFPHNWCNTDAYAAKLDISTGNLIWETQLDYDEDTDPTNDWVCPMDPQANTTPDNWDIQNKECIFDIIEDPLGGILMCGNTSHNYDDGYIMRLFDECNDNLVTLQLDMDFNAPDISWEIIPDTGGPPVCSGSGYTANASVSPTCCLPDGCYQLIVYNNSGISICPQCPSPLDSFGYTLFDINQNRIIDNAIDGDGSIDAVSSISTTNNRDFCVPIGATGMDANADSYDNNNFDRYGIITAEENPLVSAEYGMGNQNDDGYLFWIYNPDGGYSRKIFQRYSNPGYAGPSNAQGPRYLSVHFWNSLMPPSNTLLNVRVAAVVSNDFDEFGPASRITFSDTCCTQLYNYEQENPWYSVGSTNMQMSCGKIFDWNSSTSGANMRIWAFPRRIQNGCSNINYRWRFTESGNSGNVIYKNTGLSYHMVLTSVPGMLPAAGTSITWDVEVGTRVGGSGPWNFCGDTCEITINNINPPASSSKLVNERELLHESSMTIWPNPNKGGVLNIALNTQNLESDNSAEFTVFNISGLRMFTEKIILDESGLAQLKLSNYLRSGVYIVELKTLSSSSRTRLVIIE